MSVTIGSPKAGSAAIIKLCGSSDDKDMSGGGNQSKSANATAEFGLHSYNLIKTPNATEGIHRGPFEVGGVYSNGDKDKMLCSNGSLTGEKVSLYDCDVSILHFSDGSSDGEY